MEPSTIEVKFSEKYLTDEVKRKAYYKFKQNNHLANSIAGLIPAEDVGFDALNESLSVPECNPGNSQSTTEEFVKGMELIRQGNIQEGLLIGKEFGLIDTRSPVISYAPENIDEARKIVLGDSNILPWTSADSITIFPLS